VKLPDDVLIELYGIDELDAQQKRYRDLVEEYLARFGNPKSLCFVSAPGRTELGGNHTDHNHGKVLCAAVCRDTVAVVEPRSDTFVKLKSSAFPGLYDLNLAHLEPREIERSTAAALIRGVAAGMEMRGYRTGGFNAVVHSDVGIGSGLSSSEAYSTHSTMKSASIRSLLLKSDSMPKMNISANRAA
jgi:galactokinase